MPHFQRSTLINAPVEVVWDFHERPGILNVLTPPWQPMQAVRHEGGLEVGAVSEFRIFIGPLPIKWVAKHTEYEKYRLFTDEQVEGPFQSWKHQHQFAAENGKTRLTDAIDYTLPAEPLTGLLGGLWVQGQLAAMFRYRHEVIQRECEIHGNDS